MAQVLESQARLQHALLRFAVRVAARFQIPMRSLSELMRMAYYAELREAGFPHNQIARRMDQTDRNVRYYALRHRENFFATELEPGLVREVEERVCQEQPNLVELKAAFPDSTERELSLALKSLLDQERITQRDDQRYELGAAHRGVSDGDAFKEQLDALEPTFGGLYHAVVQRLVHDLSVSARIRSITFNAQEAAVLSFMERFEGDLRKGVADLERAAALSGRGKPYALNLTLAPTQIAKAARK